MKPLDVHLVPNTTTNTNNTNNNSNNMEMDVDSNTNTNINTNTNTNINTNANATSVNTETKTEDPIIHAIYRCLLYLGDLTRYRGLYCSSINNTGTRGKNNIAIDIQTKNRIFQIAEKFYTRASQLIPRYGNAYLICCLIPIKQVHQFCL